MVTQSLSQEWKVNLTYEKPVNVIEYNKKKNHMIISKDTKKRIWEILIFISDSNS